MTQPACDSRLTILVTTYNRYARLRRLLRYVASVQSPFRILVLDSSDEPLVLDDLRALLQGDHVRHLVFEPTTPPMQKLSEGLAHVTSPYVVTWADDDFLVSRSLEAGVDFLGAHQDYSVVHGRAALFCREWIDGRWTLGCLPYWQRAITHDTASARLRDHLINYSVLNYSIHRTERLRQNVALCCERGFGYSWGEIALGSFSAIQGKVHMMNRLYLVKETHAEPDAWLTWLQGSACQRKFDTFDWVTEDAFPASSRLFRDALVDSLAHEEGLGVSTAQAIVREAFWCYVATCLSRNWRRRHSPRDRGWRARLRDFVRELPGARQAWRRARWVVPHRRDTISLPALLQPSSRYHTDFLPVYRAILTHEQEERLMARGAVGQPQAPARPSATASMAS